MNKAAVIVEEEIPAPTAEDTQLAIDKANGNETSTESNLDENLWSDLEASMDVDDEDSTESDDSEEEAAPIEAESTPAPVEEAAPATPIAEETKEVEVPVEIPAATPEVATPQQIEPTSVAEVPPSPPVPQLSPEEVRAGQQEKRAAAVEGMAKHYSLSDEDATTLLTDPGSIMPRLRAEQFMDVFDAVMNGMTQAIPGIVQGMNTQADARTKAEDGFYAANPLLDKGQHSETVNRYAQAYLNAVPNATPEQVVKDVGVQVMFALGINPAQVVTPAPIETPAPVPYVPAGAGTANASQKSGKANNGVWGDIADELMDEDE